MTAAGGPDGVASASSTRRSAPASSAGETRDAAARRLAALAALVPPFAHKLGNSLGAVTGLIDLVQRRGPSADPTWLPEAREQARLSHELVQLLARLARPPSGRAETEDLGALVERATALVEPLAQTRGARTLRPRIRGTPVARIDGVAALQWLCVAAVEVFGPPDPEGLRPEAMRFAARGVAGAAELSFCLAWRTAAPGRERGEPSPCSAGAVGVRSRARSVRAVLRIAAAPGVRRAPPSAPAALPAARVATSDGHAPRLLLFEPDAALGDLIAMVLGEAGYDVERAGDADGVLRGARVGAFDLVLADAGGLDPRASRALAEVAAPGGVPIAWLGRPAAHHAGAAAALAKPFRPADLLAYVEARLPRRT